MSEYGEDCDILARNSIDKGVPSREGSISEIIGPEAGEGRAPAVGVDVDAISALTGVNEDDGSAKPMEKWTGPDQSDPDQSANAVGPARNMSENACGSETLDRISIDTGDHARERTISEIIGHEAGEGRAVGVDVNAISALTTVTEDDSSVSCSDTMSSARMSTTAITPTRPSRSPRIPLDATLGATAMPDEVFLDLDPPQGVWTTQPSDHEENMDSVA
jgi:hypothetical protein